MSNTNPLSSPPLWCPWDLFRSSKVFSGDKERVGCGKQLEDTRSIQSLVKLQPWFLSLRWKTCLRQNCSLGFCAYSEGPAFGQNTQECLKLMYTLFDIMLFPSNEPRQKYNLCCVLFLNLL